MVPPLAPRVCEGPVGRLQLGGARATPAILVPAAVRAAPGHVREGGQRYSLEMG
jgi:hypothetical protein